MCPTNRAHYFPQPNHTRYLSYKKMQQQSVVLLESFHTFMQASHVLITTAVIRGRQITGNSRPVVEGSLVTVVGR